MNDDEIELIHSPLERTLSGEGHTLHIGIYRGAAEPDWILEIEDETGTSTSFDERFATDQAALDAALAEIEAEGGMHRFCVNAQAEAQAHEAAFFAKLDAQRTEGTKGKARPTAKSAAAHPMMTPLSEVELEELGWLLLEADAEEGMPLDTLDGFLHALAIGPATVMPSRWLPKVWGLDDGGMMPPMKSLEQVNHLMGLIMRHHNSIIAGLEQSPPMFAPMWGTRQNDRLGNYEDAEMWAMGFVEGTTLSEAAWQPLLSLPQGQRWYRPIQLLGSEDESPEAIEQIATPEQRAALTAQIEHSVLQMHAYWLPLRQAVAERHTAQAMSTKVGRNEPCPCGSGKKFKKCCGAPSELH